MSLTEIIK